MLFASILSISLVALSTFAHYEVLQVCSAILPRLSFIARRAKVLVAMGCAMGSHTLHIVMFALAYYLLQDEAGLGSLHGVFQNAFAGFLYFSTETYTSLGLGDVYPMGDIRMVAGIEALTGLLMISWTASFTFLEMSRYWRDR